MRILFVAHSFPPRDRPLANIGGMQRVATELHAALSQMDEIANPALLQRSSWRWIHIRTGLFLFVALFRIARMVRRNEVDVLLFSSMVTASLAPLLHRILHRYGVPAATIVHGRDVTLGVAPYQSLIPRVFAALDAVLPVSSATGQVCLDRGLHPAKLHVVPNGVSIRRFREHVPADRARARLLARFDPEGRFPKHGLLLCSVGRQVKRKGYAWFVEHVLPTLPEDVHYWLAGEGPESDHILDVARRRGVERRIRLLGCISEEDLETFYRGADVFLMPNIPVPGDMEGFGVVMLEAGLCGLPTVASRLDGITDVIEDGKNGRLVDPGNAQAFSEAILRFRDEPNALPAARVRAHRYVSDRFGWRKIAERYVAVIRTMLPAEAVPAKIPG